MIRARSVRRHAALLFALCSVVIFGSLPAPSWSKPADKQKRLAAERTLRQAIGALAMRDFPEAYRGLVDSYHQRPQPTVLYYLGALALAEGRTLDAQDLMRRYLADPQQDSPAGSEEQQAAERIIALPRPLHGKLSLIGDPGLRVSVDDRLVGMLPLSRPLLVTPGSHQITLESGARRHVERVEVAAARFVEMRYQSESSTVVLSALPVILLFDEYAGPIADAQIQLSRVVEEQLQAEHMSPLRREEAMEAVHDAELARCLDTLPCQAKLAQENGAAYALRLLTRGAGDGKGLALRMEMLVAAVGEVVTPRELTCPGSCSKDEARAMLVKPLQELLEDASHRPYGSLSITSTPPGAEVRIGERRLGLTPLTHALFAGATELRIEQGGYQPAFRKVEVREAEATTLNVELQRPIEGAQTVSELRWVRKPRSRGRIIAGASITAGGLVFFAVGAAALAANGGCVGDRPAPGALCLQIHDTATIGGALLGVGLGIIGGGALFAGLPEPRRPAITTRMK